MTDKRDPIVEAVRAKLLYRSQVGLTKYGVGLDREDLSTLDWLIHLQEELLDASCYLQRLMLIYENVQFDIKELDNVKTNNTNTTK
jgi:hypothetical protein